MANLYLRSLVDKNEVGYPAYLRLGAATDRPWTVALTIYVMINHVWKTSSVQKIMVGSAWKAIAAMKIMVGGAWKTKT